MGEEIESLEVELDRRMKRRPPAEKVAAINGHDKAILDFLRSGARKRSRRARGAGRGGERAVGGERSAG
jgi:hypothetical protein